MPDLDLLIFGRTGPLAEMLRLRAGPFAMVFDSETASMRRIFLEDREIIRAIYPVVKDRDGRVVPPRLENLRANAAANSFELTFDVYCQRGGIDFFWRGGITGKADATVQVRFDGEARSTFLHHRLGLCLRHPIRECCGARGFYGRNDNWKVELAFPRNIEPPIPGEASFTAMRTLAHEVRPGTWAELVFDGGIFEMEDWRNWADASFKTYGTPLARPFPVEIKSGTRIKQSVTLRLTSDPTISESPDPPGKTHHQLRLSGDPPETGSISRVPAPTPGISREDLRSPLKLPTEPVSDLPRWGLGLASHGQSSSPIEHQRLAALRLAHLRADLRLTDSSWTRTLASAADEARMVGSSLELALHLPATEAEANLGAVRDLLQKLSIVPARVLVFRQDEEATSSATLRQARTVLNLPGVPIGGGSDAHFCELNRAQALGKFDPVEADFVSWPITPQVRAFDDRSIMETLEAQPHTVRSARAFADGKPLLISPVTLKPRCHAMATDGESRGASDDLPPPVDPRQMSLFNAAWTMGSMAALTNAGAASVTFFETTGWCGVMETQAGSPLPERFPSIPGAVFPVFHVFAALARFRWMAPLPGCDSCKQAGLVLFDDANRRRILLTNLTPETLPVRLAVGAVPVRGWILDEDHVERAMREPEAFIAEPAEWTSNSAGTLALELKRYACAWFDLDS